MMAMAWWLTLLEYQHIPLNYNLCWDRMGQMLIASYV